MAKKPEKAVKVMELLNKNPDYANEYVAAKAGCHPTYVKQLRKKMAHADQPELDYDGPIIGKIENFTHDDVAELVYNVTRGRQARKADAKPGEYIEVDGELTPNEIDTILDERGARYGSFMTHAEITQRLKQMAYNYIDDNKLAADQIEALDMIFHKIGRIINGDPDYVDSWVDIAGYAKLVADRLQGVER